MLKLLGGLTRNRVNIVRRYVVDPTIIGAGIAAGTKLLGGLMGSAEANKAAQRDWDNQKLVLKNQIYWKAQDAIRAGLHPLAGLGVNPASGPAPTQVGGMGDAMASMGQDIGRAAEAMMTPEDKAGSRMLQLQVEGQTLNNELLKTQIASQRMRNMQQATPGVPSTGRPVMGKPAELPMPGLAKGWKVSHPGLGQQAEDHYSDVGGFVFGGAALLQDAIKYMGLERLLTNDPAGTAAVINQGRKMFKSRSADGVDFSGAM